MSSTYLLSRFKEFHATTSYYQSGNGLSKTNLCEQDLVKYTWKDHRDYESLVGAVEKVKEVATLLNQRKGAAENQAKLSEIDSLLYGKFEVQAKLLLT